MQWVEELENELQRRRSKGKGKSKPEGEEQEHQVHQVQELEELLTMLLRNNKGGARLEVPSFKGSLKLKDLFDWVGVMEKYFDWEEMEDPKRVKFACTKLKGHVTLWWEHIQKEKVQKNKEKIRMWNKMVLKIKEKIIPTD